jgi:hypothetical protein
MAFLCGRLNPKKPVFAQIPCFFRRTVLLGLVLRFTRGGAYWASWILLGAVLPSLVGIFIVPPLKGLPIPDFAARFPFGASVNGAWGFGTALILRLTGAARRQ